jgi:ligand-binding sensor domain-containing protein/signal transduction histidine kinase
MRSRRIALWIALAQAAVAASPNLNEYSRRLWRMEDGLPQNRIRAICQTPDGYLWIGTSEGLARFDGVRFVVFDQSNTQALRSNGVLALLAGTDGTLWIGAEGGGLIAYQRGAFRNFGADEGLTNGFVRALFEDRHRTLWVGTDRGFFRQEGGRFLRLDGTSEVPLVSVLGIAADHDGRIWVASAAGLLTVTDNQLRRVHSGCAAGSVRTLYPSSDGTLWAVGDRGAHRIRDACLVPHPSLPVAPMRSIIEDRTGNLWIGAMGEGLIRFANGRATSFRTSSGLPDNTVNALFEDREGNLWIGSEDGLMRLTTGSGVMIGGAEGLADDNVLTVYADRQENLWLATLTGKVYRVAGGSVVEHRLPAPADGLRVRNVHQDRNGTFWFGTQNGGLVRVDRDPQGRGRATVLDKSSGLRSNTVRQIVEDGAGALWAALDSGLSRWDGHSFRNYYLEQGLSYPSVRCLIVDARGDLLAGTDRGLNRVHNGEIVHDNEFAALAQEKIWAMREEPDGTLWLGTRDGGLVRFRAGSVLRFGRNNGLMTNTIFQILDDRQGKLWMSTSAGVISVDRKELQAPADGNPPMIQVVPFGTSEGMATSQMNGGFQPAGAVTANGDLWFPTVKGVAHIVPARFPVQRLAALLIERVAVDDRPVALAKSITIEPGHDRLVIDFTLCDLLNPQRVSFRYRLEPFDREWTSGLHTRSASYTNLPPGRYRFRVTGTDTASPGAAEASIDITLRPFFYQTDWFYGLLALAAAAVASAGLALYARQTRARYALLLSERTRLAREMHDTVIQGCVGISTLLDAANRFRDLDASEAEALLAQASLQAKETLEEARQAVWDLRHSEMVESAVHMLFDLARRLGAENGIQIETKMTGSGSLDPEIDRAILLVGREALHNAVTHAHARCIRLSVEVEAAEVHLEVSDDGIGFSSASGGNGDNRHFGLVGMRERLEKLKGELVIVSRPGNGTRVMARIPLPAARNGRPTVPRSRAGAP